MMGQLNYVIVIYCIRAPVCLYKLREQLLFQNAQLAGGERVARVTVCVRKKLCVLLLCLG